MIYSTFLISIFGLFLSTPASADIPNNISKKDFSYSFGVYIGKSLIAEGLDSNDIDSKMFLEALQATLGDKKLKWDQQQAQMIVMTKLQEIQAKQAKNISKEHKVFFDNNAKKKGMILLPSGVQYSILKNGRGESVKAEDTIRVHYVGSLADGTIFDSSVARNQPVTLGVDQVIPGWQEILPKMNVGSKWKIFIPSNLGYGSKSAGSIPPNSILIFEIEVLGIEK